MCVGLVCPNVLRHDAIPPEPFVDAAAIQDEAYEQVATDSERALSHLFLVDRARDAEHLRKTTGIATLRDLRDVDAVAAHTVDHALGRPNPWASNTKTTP